MKNLAIILIVSISFFTYNAQAADKNDPYYWTPPSGMVRGVGNVATCPLELFRGMTYWTAKSYNYSPIASVGGFVFGTVSGLCWTGARFTVGFIDLAGGFFGNICYGDSFPTWAWEDRWLPEKFDE